MARAGGRLLPTSAHPESPVGSRPSFGAVVLSMGTRPADLSRVLESLLRQRGVDLDVLVVGNGWTPDGLPGPVRSVALSRNVGVPEGRNVGARLVRGEILFFIDDDAYLPDTTVLSRLAEVFDAHPKGGIVQPRAVDPNGLPSPRRWVPRLRVGDPTRGGVVAGVWEGVFAIRRLAFTEAGGWPGDFFYAHEGIELVWRLYDAGWVAWYAPEIIINHPATSPTRHAPYYRMNARNRVWVARRNLPLPLAIGYVGVWVVLTLARVRAVAPLRVWFAGLWEGVRTPCGPRRPVRWRTVLRLTLAGRPPLV
jgi:GT2 family glycosyltransferase